MCLISSITYVILLYVDVDGQTVTIVTDPAGVPVDGQNNTFDYHILTNVTLMCIATAANGSPATVTSYHWNSNDITINIPNSHAITFDNLLANDNGRVSCTATIDGTDYTSDPLTLRISGELNHHFMILSSRNTIGLWMDILD